MFDHDGFHFHCDFKYGKPASARTMTTGIKVVKTKNNKNFADRFTRWLAHASHPFYNQSKKTMKLLDTSAFQDFLFGVGNEFSIMEVCSVTIGDMFNTFRAGLLFYHFRKARCLLVTVHKDKAFKTTEKKEAVKDSPEDDTPPLIPQFSIRRMAK